MFASREDAGRKLGQYWQEERIRADLVLSLPRGGVVVGAEVARALQAPLDVLIVRKIGHPRHREFAVGALAEGDVILLDEEDLPKFFTFRGDGVRLESVSNVEWKQGRRPDFTRVKDSGVLYVLDEVHIAFNSRAWAETGAEVLYYLSQHRKLGDDVVCITQSVGNVDKQFRSVAQDFTYIKNLSKQRAGLFRLPAIFTRNTYAHPATDTSKPMETGTFKLDVSGLASVYDTARGVGIHGRAGADTNARKKGVHWLVALVGFPLLVWAVFHFAPKILVGLTSPSKSPLVVHSEKQETSVSPAPNEKQSSPVRAVARENQGQTTNEVFCIGHFGSGYGAQVYLSDGRVAYGDSGEVQSIADRTVTAFGHVFRMAVGAAFTSFHAVPSTPQEANELQSYARPVNQADVTVIGKRSVSGTPARSHFQNVNDAGSRNSSAEAH